MKKPKRNLKLSSLPFDIASHPSHELTAVSNIEGEIIFLSLKDDISKQDTIQPHSDSCRRILFSDTSLLSISSDKSFVVSDLETKKVQKKFTDAHENALYALCEVRDGKVFATGDDEGVIKLWDLRKEDPILMIQPEHSNFISSFSVDSTGSTLLAASGDGRLSVWNSRQRKLIARSDECDSELLTCNVVRANSKVVCGDGEGVLNIFTWDDWGDISDRVPVQEEVSIDSVLCYSEQVLVLGCMDGVIRATSLFPHTPLSHIGDHADSPIEAMCLSPDEEEILSVGHDYFVRAWCVEKLNEDMKKLSYEDSDDDSHDSEDGDSDSDSSEDDKPKRKKLKHISSKEIKSQESADFFSDLA